MKSHHLDYNWYSAFVLLIFCNSIAFEIVAAAPDGDSIIIDNNLNSDGVGGGGSEKLKNFNVSIEFITDMKKFLSENRDRDMVKMERVVIRDGAKSATGKLLVQYFIGRREYGDRLVASGVDRITFLTPRDFRQVFEYPAAGVGAVVTHVQVNCEQDNEQGTAYVIAGGIGQRRIVFAVEAYATTVFGYELYIFGVY